MLRITHERLSSKEVRLVAEGQLRGPWVGELERSCAPFLGNGRKVSVNLEEVAFADREGMALLQRLEAAGVELTFSAFLAELLRTATVDGAGPQPAGQSQDTIDRTPKNPGQTSASEGDGESNQS